jgi:hypothetical protein
VNTLRWIRAWLILFIVCLVLAGLTAFPLEIELRILTDVLQNTPAVQWFPDAVAFFVLVRDGLIDTYAQYPFLGYGTDWLAYAHIAIAFVFIGPLRDPIRNVWVVQWAMIACVLIIPVALIAGPIRGIPLPWQLIDMSFGVFGLIPLIVVLRLTRRLEREKAVAEV